MMRWRLAALPLMAVTFGTGCEPAPRGPALRQIDSVRVAETDDVFLGRLVEIAIGRNGHVFASDGAQRRVAEIASNGSIVRTFGKGGQGPGELARPTALALGGDSVLLVLDGGSMRLNRFDLRTGAFLNSVPLNFSLLGTKMRVVGDDILFTHPDASTGTSLVTVSPSGDRERAEGIVPDIGVKFPVLLSTFTTIAFDVHGDDVYAAYDLSPVIHRWKRGARGASEIAIPIVSRRGSSAAHFQELVFDPDNAGSRAYDHSMPQALEVVGDSTLVLLTMDLQQVETRFEGAYHVTIVDLEQRRACADVSLPLPRDPLPKVTLKADTIVALQQGFAADSTSAAAIRRFVVDREACEWRDLPS